MRCSGFHFDFNHQSFLRFDDDRAADGNEGAAARGPLLAADVHRAFAKDIGVRLAGLADDIRRRHDRAGQRIQQAV